MPQNRGYFLGRLFGLLVKLGGLEQPPEQYYRQASANPPQVLSQALATVIAAGKEEALFSLMECLPLDAFDGPLNRREQGAFALGYTHERIGFALPEEEQDEEGQELTERYEFRLDPQLKEWIKREGGGSFLRTLLRNERARQIAASPSAQRQENREPPSNT
jgi:hypothetical protein